MDDFHGALIHYGYKTYPQEGSAAGMRSMKKYEVAILVNQEGKWFVDEGENSSDKTYAKFGTIVARANVTVPTLFLTPRIGILSIPITFDQNGD